MILQKNKLLLQSDRTWKTEGCFNILVQCKLVLCIQLNTQLLSLEIDLLWHVYTLIEVKHLCAYYTMSKPRHWGDPEVKHSRKQVMTKRESIDLIQFNRSLVISIC